MARLMTATEFLEAFEPQTLDLLPEPEAANEEDRDRARQLADRYGVTTRCDESGRYPPIVWACVYR